MENSRVGYMKEGKQKKRRGSEIERVRRKE